MSDMEWDISPMVGRVSSSEVKKKLDALVVKLEKHCAETGDTCASMDAASLVKALQKLEALSVEFRDVSAYCSLRYNANTTDAEATQLNSWANVAESKVEAASTVMEIRLGNMLLDDSAFLQSPVTKVYHHFLEGLKDEAPYKLSEAEETLVSAKDVNGTTALMQLQESWVSEKTFDIEVKGVKKTLPISEVSSLRVSPLRETREMASRILYKSYADDRTLHATALNAICADHVMMTKRRGMPSTMTESLLDHDVDESTIQALLSAIVKTASTYQEFLKLKAKYMGCKKLLGYDIIAPWVTEISWSLEWPQARAMVIDSFSSFDKEMGAVVSDTFTGHRIDAVNRVGKTSGAFCAEWLGQKKSFVFMSYSKTMDDLYTLAHECGHAAQGHLDYKVNTPLNYCSSMCMAETGSIFGELLLTDKLLSKSNSDAQRFETLSHVLDGYFYTVYYVGMRALYEQELYKAIQDDKLLDAGLATDLWVSSKKAIFGNVVDWTEYMEYEWARIPHFFMAGYRFYNYPYSFAQMLVYAVYEAYRKGEPDFNERFKRLLSRGSTMNARDQIAEFGFDITDPGFWELGEFKKLI
jgi:oligoendopeptidase F